MLRITGLKDLGGHEDIMVEFNDRQWTCDSYYFWVDPLIPNTLSVEQTLQILLTQWLAIIQTTTAGIRFLPFDFSDQSTGCFECRIQDATITIRVGWSHFEGHRVPPSNITAYSTTVTDFRTQTIPITLQKTVFMHAINTVIQTLQDDETNAAGSEDGV